MNIIQEADQIRIVALEDWIATQAVALQAQLLKDIHKIRDCKIVLDLTRITRMDSLGIKLVIGLFKTCQANNNVLQVVVSSLAILKLLKVCSLDALIDIREANANGNAE